MRPFRTGLNPSIYWIGELPDGRNLYRTETNIGPAYWATEELVTDWSEGTWWTAERPEVQQWLKERRFGP